MADTIDDLFDEFSDEVVGRVSEWPIELIIRFRNIMDGELQRRADESEYPRDLAYGMDDDTRLVMEEYMGPAVDDEWIADYGDW